MGVVSRARNYVNTTARAAYHYPMLRYGFSVGGQRQLTRGQTAKYFLQGLGYSVLDVLKPSKSSAPGYRQMKTALVAVDSGQGSFARTRAIIVTPGGPITSNVTLMTGRVRGGGLPSVKAETVSKVYAAMTKSQHAVLAVEEIALVTSLGVQIVKKALSVLAADPPEGMEKVFNLQGFFYFEGLPAALKTTEFQKACGRFDKRLETFHRAIAEKRTAIENLDGTATVQDVIQALNRKKGKLGLRLLDILLSKKRGELTLEQREALPSDFYRPSRVPEALIQAVLAQKDVYHFVIELGENNVDARTSVEGAGLNWDRSFGKLFDSLRKEGREYLLIVKALAEDKSPRAIMVITDPLFFGEREQTTVIGQLNLLAKAVGRKLEQIMPQRTEASEGIPVVAETTGVTTGTPYSETQYDSSSVVSVSYGTDGTRFTTETNNDPAKYFGRIADRVMNDYNAVAKAIYGQKLPTEEMRHHALLVSHSFTDRVGPEVTGFATADLNQGFIDHEGRKRPLIYFAGIMAKKEYRGHRGMYLSLRLLLGVFKDIGLPRLIFGRSVPLVFRTQDERIVKFGRRYCKAKDDAASFSEEDWAAARFVARQNNWELEEGTNISRRAYSIRMSEGDHLLSELGELDGKVCVGYVGILSFLRLWADFTWFKKKFLNGKGNKTTQV